MNRNDDHFARRALTGAGITALVASLLLLIWSAADVLLLAFAGILLAILLRGLSDWLSSHSPLSGRWSLAVVLLLLAGLIGLGAWLMGPSLAEQFNQLAERLPRAIEQLRRRVESQEWARQLLDRAPEAERFVPRRGDILSKATGLASGTLGGLASVVVVLFVGLYLAFEPGVYRRGLIRLVPVANRPRAREVLGAVGSTLRGWLIGKVFSMVVVGVLTAIGLGLLGIPLALTLGLLTALLTFIPNIGPILSFIPAGLIALVQGPTQVLYVLGLYVAIQTVESYLITPLVQRQMVALPPALIILAQVLLGVLQGGLGLLLATPLTAAAMVLVKMLYVEDTLGDPVDDAGERGDAPSEPEG